MTQINLENGYYLIDPPLEILNTMKVIGVSQFNLYIYNIFIGTFSNTVNFNTLIMKSLLNIAVHQHEIESILIMILLS